MIIALGVACPLSRFEEKVSGEELKNHASEGPDIRSVVVVDSQDDLWGPVLPCLNLRLEVMMNPACVAEVSNFDPKGFVEVYFPTNFKIASNKLEQKLFNR